MKKEHSKKTSIKRSEAKFLSAKNEHLPIKKGPVMSSFRDPSGFVFSSNELIFRQINYSYQDNYDLLINSGLYDKLTSLGYLIPHQEVKSAKTSSEAYKTIQPQKIPFISFPYEWCFSMLKAAALLTLEIQKIALEFGMSLKDASTFNIQFLEGRPIFIDTLSFEKYKEGKPWVAYKQFVEHFLAPLSLMSYTDIRLNRLSALFIDGIPVDLASHLLPFRTRFKPSLLLHIYAHSTSQKRFSQKKLTDSQLQHSFSNRALLGLLDSLEGVIKGLKWNSKKTQWSDYYEEDKNNYNSQSLIQKAGLVRKFTKSINPKNVWDIGANSGLFSRIAAESGALVISFDIDYGALEKNYSETIKKGEKNILPLFCDLTNPTPSLGWANEERLSLIQRGPTNLLLALALIHHLAISQNVPLSYIASLFSQIGHFLIIEFIPKDDSQIKRLLANREDIFPKYNKENFEKTFENFFQIKASLPIDKSRRILYLMEKRKR